MDKLHRADTLVVDGDAVNVAYIFSSKYFHDPEMSL